MNDGLLWIIIWIACFPLAYLLGELVHHIALFIEKWRNHK